jgi:rubrerythrin
MNEPNESVVDSGERLRFDTEHDSPWDAHDAPVLMVCFGCGHAFRDDDMETGGECPECGSDDIEELKE